MDTFNTAVHQRVSVHFPQFGLWLEQLGPLYWPDEQP